MAHLGSRHLGFRALRPRGLATIYSLQTNIAMCGLLFLAATITMAFLPQTEAPAKARGS